MTDKTNFFQKKWYHLAMAAIYITIGIVFIVKSKSSDQTNQLPAFAGWLFCAYGTYRIISRLVFRKNQEQDE